MPYFQELCRVQITWLREGDVCLQSKLGQNDYARRDVIAHFGRKDRPISQPASKDKLLEAMLSRNNRSLLEESASAEDPLVQVCVPVTLYEFDPVDTTEGWLEAGMFDRGAASMFAAHLDDLADIGEHFARLGRFAERGCWGVSVCFHTLWVFNTAKLEPGATVDSQLAGYVDLTRVPLGIFAELPPVRARMTNAQEVVQE